MGRLIWLIAAAALLCGCRTQKVASESLTADTVMVRDTLYGRDSAAVVKAERLSEKMLVKDSTVVTVDAAGKVVRLERYSSVLKDRDRHVSRDSARAVTSGRATERRAGMCRRRRVRRLPETKAGVRLPLSPPWRRCAAL